MTTSAFTTVLLILAATTSQSNPRDMLQATIDTEEAISHGEIVFRYDADTGVEMNEGASPGRETIPDKATIIFTFRDLRQFRIVVQANDGTSRTIVSDGEHIDMGNGEIWDYRYFDRPFSSAIDEEDMTFFNRIWPYNLIIRRHLYPLRFDVLNLVFLHERRSKFRLDPHPDDPAGGTSIELKLPGWNALGFRERYIVLPKLGHRLVQFDQYNDGERWWREEWGDVKELGNERYVSSTYRHTIFLEGVDQSYGSKIDFGASNFDHIPAETEFVIDVNDAKRIVVWRPPNPLAEEVEYYVDDWFGLDIDVEPLAARVGILILGAVAVAVVLVLILAVRRSRNT